MNFHEFLPDIMDFGPFNVRDLVQIISQEYREKYRENYRDFMEVLKRILH